MLFLVSGSVLTVFGQSPTIDRPIIQFVGLPLYSSRTIPTDIAMGTDDCSSFCDRGAISLTNC